MPQSPEVSRWKKYLYDASRSRRFLWKIVIGTLLVSVVIGYALSRTHQSESYLFADRVLARAGLSLRQDDYEPGPKKSGMEQPRDGTAFDIVTPFEDELAQPGIEYRDVVHAIPRLARYFRIETIDAVHPALIKKFGEAPANFLADFLGAWDAKNTSARNNLEMLAASPAPPRYANYALGRIRMDRKVYAGAYQSFRRECEFHRAPESRHAAINALVESENFDELERLVQEPEFKSSISPYLHLQLATHHRDWRSIFKWVPLGQLESYELRSTILSLIAGLAWAFFLAHLGEWRLWFSGRAGLALLGFVLGVFSTTPTISLAVIEEDLLHFGRGEEVRDIFLYTIGGVGLREELCKLVLFLPLLPFLLKRDDELEALIVACFVGLGFAVEENANYFLSSEGSSVAGRFLSANFFHIALTGLNGLALFRACSGRAGGWNEFLYVLPVTIFAHGLYDGFIEMPDAEGLGGYFAMAVYVATSLWFFRHAMPLRENRRMTISLSGAFVAALSLVMASIIVYQMMNLGAQAGLLVAWSELLGSALIVFMFFRAFNEQLAA